MLPEPDRGGNALSEASARGEGTQGPGNLEFVSGQGICLAFRVGVYKWLFPKAALDENLPQPLWALPVPWQTEIFEL